MVVRIYPGQGNLLYAKALVIRRNEPSRTIRILCFYFLQSLRTIRIRYIVVWTHMRIIRRQWVYFLQTTTLCRMDPCVLRESVDSESTLCKSLFHTKEWTFENNPYIMHLLPSMLRTIMYTVHILSSKMKNNQKMHGYLVPSVRNNENNL